jgi:flagellar motor protein MotB
LRKDAETRACRPFRWVEERQERCDRHRGHIAAARLSALGVGEMRPIAGNGDENGRALNRRVAVICK